MTIIHEDKYGLYIIKDVGYSRSDTYRPLGTSKFKAGDVITCGCLDITKTRPTQVIGVHRTSRGVYDEYWPLLKTRFMDRCGPREMEVYIDMISKGMTYAENHGIPFFMNETLPNSKRFVMDDNTIIYKTLYDGTYIRHNDTGYPSYIRRDGKIQFVIRGYVFGSAESYIKASGLSDETACYLKLRYGNTLPKTIMEYGIENMLPEDRFGWKY